MKSTRFIIFVFALLSTIGCLAATYHMDFSSHLQNPSFNGNINGWVFNQPKSKASGYQSASYTNGDVTINGFIEAWLPYQDGALGAGSLHQTTNTLSDGTYTLEADIIACNQGGTTLEGAYFYAESNGKTQRVSCSTTSGKPVHYSLTIDVVGSLTVGLMTESTSTANWIAMDNVKISGDIELGDYDVNNLQVNEVQVNNLDQFIDPSYNYGGWVEIYNSSDEVIPMGGLYVSDDRTNLTKFQLPSGFGLIAARGYRNIWFDHNAANGDYSGNAENNVDFKLNMDGGTFYLSTSDGQLITSITYPAGVARCSYARDMYGVWGMTSTPTPELVNSGIVLSTERLAAPVVSRDGGVFTSGTEVTFSVEIPNGATLRYTTDGSTPSLINGKTSSNGSFSVDATTVYRFALFQEGMLPSPVVTRSFIYKNHDYYLPIISVVTAPDNLYGDEIGVYVKGTNGSSGNGQSSACNWNRDWERPVNVELMMPDKNEAGSYITTINQGADFEVAGGWSRAFGGGYTDGKYWPMKGSFRLKTDKRYESQNSFDYPIFDYKPYNKYKVWQVRNGGNDNWSRCKDAVIGRMVLESGFYVDAQDAQPAHVFFNGKYLGMLNIRESNNRHYGDSNYGIDTDDMDQFDLSNAQYNQKVGDSKAWDEVVKLSAQLRSTQSEAVWKQICERVDMDEYINYMALECYIESNDWITNTNNVKGFRSRSDGKFHFVLFDTDQAFSYPNIISAIATTGGGATVADFFQNIYSYPAFKQQFIDAYSIVNGCVFDPDQCSNLVDDWYSLTNTALGFEDHSSNTDLKSNISSRHNGSAIGYMRSFYGLPSPYNLKLSANIPSARLSLNGQLIPTNRFNGYVYNNQGNGIYLTAKAPAGYTFKGWRMEGLGAGVDVTEETLLPTASRWYYYDKGALDGKDWKAMDYDAAGDGWSESQAPFSYAKDGKVMATDRNTLLTSSLSTYYFRHHLNLTEGPKSNETYYFHYKLDDGCRVHVNGHDVGGYHLEQGATYADYASTWVGDDPYEDEIDITSYLTAGDNIVAVEVHNVSNSSDIYFEGWITKQTSVERDPASNYLATTETFCLTDKLKDTGDYTLEAIYEPLSSVTKRYEDGGVPIRINEVSAGNDIYINEHFKKNDWVELYNTTDSDIDVSGMYLSDNQKKPQKWQITGEDIDGVEVNTIVPAHGHLVVWCDELQSVSQLHSPFKLSNADGACVSIQAADGRWADRMTYLEQPRWYTYGRYPDGSNHEQLLAQPTIEKANRQGLYDYNNIGDQDFLSDDVTITLALNEGWNWTSHNLSESVHNSRFTTYASIIRGRTSELLLDPELGWQGRLTSLEATKGYKIEMKQAAEITLCGDLYSALTPVTLQQGWNWIGFPLANSTVLAAALANYDASEGDMVVAQDAFATYADGAWTGSLTVLQPGQSYQLKTDKEQSFCWNALSSNLVHQRRYSSARREESSPWSLNIHAYPDVMTLIAQLDIEGLDLNGPYYVAAFCGDECRGIAKVVDERLFFTIHGEVEAPITFQLLDAEGDTYHSTERFNFRDHMTLGSIQQPLLLHFMATDAIMATAPSKVISTHYFNLNGQHISRPTAICLQKTTLSDGTVKVKKIISR